MPSTASGIVYPSITDDVNVPDDMQTMANSLETIIAALGKAIDYVPVLDNAVMGAGAVSEGWYSLIGDTVSWGFRLEFGTAPSWSSTIQIHLPIPAWTGAGTNIQMTMGAYIYRVSSTQHWTGSMGIWAGDGGSASFDGAWDATSPKGRMSGPAALPAVPLAASVLSGSGVYRKQ